MISDERKAEIASLKNKDMIEEGISLQDKANAFYEELKFLKFQLLRRMRDDKATTFPHPEIECTAKKDNTSWDYNTLRPILELLDKSDIEAFYSPEHEETIIVEEKYDMRIGKGYLKYGGEVKEIIERATQPGEIKDVILKRKG